MVTEDGILFYLSLVSVLGLLQKYMYSIHVI